MNGKYYHSKESIQEYIELAKDVSGKVIIEKLKQFLHVNFKLLEIGSVLVPTGTF